MSRFSESESSPQPPINLLKPLSPQTRRSMRKAFLILITVGVVIGGLTAAGVVKVMNHFNLIGVPEQPQRP